jgi:hypothetical protein
MMLGAVAASSKRTKRETLSNAGGGAITMSVVAEFVDTSGVPQRVTLQADGSTVINIRRWGIVHYLLTGTRSTVSDCNTEHGAYFNAGYRVKYGEGATGNWPYNGDTSTRAIDQEWGQPVFGHVYSVLGSHTTTLRSRDSAVNEADITCTVVVSNYANSEVIDVGDGVWPTWANDTQYTVVGDYGAFADIRTYPTDAGATNGLHNIAIVGEGLTHVPIWVVDGRDNVSAGAVTRSAGIRLVGCSTPKMEFHYVGYDGCGVYAGYCGEYGPGGGGPTDYGFSQAVINNRGQTTADNIRHPRCGFIILSEFDGDTYCYIRSGYGMVFQGNLMTVTSGTKEHVYRPYNAASVLRNNLERTTSAAGSKSWVKGSAATSSYTETPIVWRDDDKAGDWTLGRALFTTYGALYSGDATRNGGDPDGVNFGYAYQAKNNVFEWNQWGDASQTAPNSVAGMGPQNNDTWNGAAPYTVNGGYELCSYSSIEHNRAYLASPSTETEIQLTGLHVGARHNVADMGAGSIIDVDTAAGPNKTPPDCNGPYYITGTRPVPSAIA